jgi:hypothetical protein
MPVPTRRLAAAVALIAVSTAAALSSAAAHAQQVLLGVDSRGNRVFTASPFDGAILNPAFIVDANDPLTFDFVTPRAAIQVNNEIWVSDQSPSINAIFRFDLSGQYVGTIGGAAGGLSNVRGMRFIDGTVYVANAGSTNGAPGAAIVRIAPDGSILGSFSTVAAGGTVGLQPWDVASYGGRLLVSDGTSRGLQLYNLDGSHHGAFASGINNIPQQIFVRENGNLLLAANGSQPLGSFGLYEIGTDGSVVAQWTGTPGLGVRGVYELGNGQYLINEAGGASLVRGYGTIDPLGTGDNTNYTLIQNLVNGGWISVAVIPEPGTWALMGAGVLLLGWRVRRRGIQAPAALA